jgi:hypothetical protein
MKKLILTLSLCGFASSLFAQVEGPNFNATGRGGVATTLSTDYQCIGINPANLGLKTKYETKHVTFGLLEVNASAFVQGANLSQIKNYLFSDNPLSFSDKATATSLFTNSAINAQVDVNLFGIAIQTDKIGGIGFSITERFNTFGNLSDKFASFAFQGALSTEFFDQVRTGDTKLRPNDPAQYDNYINNNGGIQSGYSTNGVSLGQIIGKSEIKSHYYRSLNFAYGRKVWGNEIIEISAGATLKYMFGYNYMNVYSDGNTLKGNVAYNALFNLADSAKFNTPTQSNDFNAINPLGTGLGVDLGVTATLFEHIKFGASLLNLGSIKYKTNTYEVKDTIIQELKYSNETLDGLNQITYWKDQSSFKVKLPTMLRFGGSISLLENKIEVGADVVVPLNQEAGNLNKTFYALGGDLNLVRWIRLSSGINWGGNYANAIEAYKTHVNVPFGFTFIIGETGGYEIGFATRDVVSLIDFQGKSPHYSIGFGFLRFRV